MSQNLVNIITAVAAAGSFLVTAVGLYAVYFQIKKLRESIWSNVHSKLCDQSFELLRFLAEKPDTYDYFYNCKVLHEESRDRIDILYRTEALANFLEHLVLQKQNLPEPQWEVWRRFISSTFECSITLRSFLDTRRDWYSSELLSLKDDFEKNLNQETLTS